MISYVDDKISRSIGVGSSIGGPDLYNIVLAYIIYIYIYIIGPIYVLLWGILP